MSFICSSVAWKIKSRVYRMYQWQEMFYWDIYSSEQYNAHSDWLKKRVYQSTKRGAPNSLLWKLESNEWRIYRILYHKTTKETFTVLCYVTKHLRSGEKHSTTSRVPPTFLSCPSPALSTWFITEQSTVKAFVNQIQRSGEFLGAFGSNIASLSCIL